MTCLPGLVQSDGGMRVRFCALTHLSVSECSVNRFRVSAYVLKRELRRMVFSSCVFPFDVRLCFVLFLSSFYFYFFLACGLGFVVFMFVPFNSCPSLFLFNLPPFLSFFFLFFLLSLPFFLFFVLNYFLLSAFVFVSFLLVFCTSHFFL